MRWQRVAWIVGAGHFIASSVLLGIHWDQIGRRLSKETVPVLAGYAVLSIVLLLCFARIGRRAGFGKQMFGVALIPYLSSSLAYLGVIAASDRFVAIAGGAGILPMLVVASYFPYLALWGPVISVANVMSLLLGRKVGGLGPHASN
ncbi:hypothetical protein [Ideonella sp. YS5]|uniref:hypothetical protein n=1 Tax=Ideonella sp. YS5 TaxID=3453714 RepID=UPI003EE92C35